MPTHLKVERLPLVMPPRFVPACGATDGGMVDAIERVDCGFCLNIARYELHLLEA